MTKIKNQIIVIPEFCTKYRREAQKALCLKQSWSDFDPQAYNLYGEDQNHETSFKGKALQAVVDSWCKIQVIIYASIGNRDSNIISGKVMDLVVTAVVAIIITILTVLVAIITRQKIGKIFLYGISGLIVGLLVGYLLTPTIISFF